MRGRLRFDPAGSVVVFDTLEFRDGKLVGREILRAGKKFQIYC